MALRAYPMTTRRSRAAGAVTLGVMLAFVTGPVLVASPGTEAQAATGNDSAITVKWAGGNDSSLQQHQVDHAGLLSDGNGSDAGSGHWNDFKNLEVTVSKTANLGDEAVTVTATGMAATQFQAYQGSASNYLQLMQCWGPDPLAEDFAETCQYGSWGGGIGDTAAGTALGKIVGRDTFTRGEWSASGAIQFEAVTGQVNKPVTIDNGGGQTTTLNGLAAFFTAGSSNEQPFVRVSSDGTATTAFEAQSAAAQPYLGCGDPDAAGSRCWLVIVPRGLHSGELAADSGFKCIGAGFGGAYGTTTAYQSGSPVNPNCSYWQDRIVVPLDFTDPYGACTVGGKEVRIVGTEVLSAAMSSWQQGLCATTGNTYSLTTNSGDLTRSQLLNGQVGLAVVANPATPDSIGSTDPAVLDEADLAYAPVANTGLAIAYVASAGSTGTIYRDLKITPRILAKALTQSYSTDLPWVSGMGGAPIQDYWPHQAQYLSADPEFTALNAGRTLPRAYGAFVVFGPQGEDAVELLWRYIQADADAVAFLEGQPDPWGNTINPYYLPSSNPNARGGGLPFNLATDPIDSFLKADRTVAPADPSGDVRLPNYDGVQQVDSLTLEPYSGSLAANVQRIFRADTRYTNEWDPTKLNPAGMLGAFAAAAPQLEQSGRFILGPGDAATVARYGLATMQLAQPLDTTTDENNLVSARTFVTPNDASMTAAMESMSIDENTGTARLDFDTLSEDAYPLTTTLYGLVDLAPDRLDKATRTQLASFLDYTAEAGNVRGEAPGQLPEGYVPLTEDQKTATQIVAAVLRTAPDEPPPDEDPEEDPTPEPSLTPAANVPNPPNGRTPDIQTPDTDSTQDDDLNLPAPETQETALPAETASVTAATASPTQAALGGALALSAGGLIASPFLLRRRGAVG